MADSRFGLRVGACALVLLSGGSPVARSAVAGAQLVARPLRGLKAEVATLIVGGGDGGALAMAVLALPEMATPVAGDENRRSVPVLFELEGASLLEGTEGTEDPAVEDAVLTVELYLYALEPSGAVGGFFSRGVRIPMAELGEALYDNGLKLLAEIALPPGGYTLRFLARESSSGRYALRSVEVDVPGEGATPPPGVSAPLVAEPSGGWLLARPVDPEGDELAERSFPRLAREGGERLPTGLAVLPLGSVVSVDLLAAGLPEDISIGAALQAHGDGSRIEIDAVLRERGPVAGGEVERLLVALRVPADAAIATYRLEMTIGDAEARLESSVEAVTLPPSEMELVWSQVRHYLAGDVLERRADVTLPRGRRRDRRDIDPAAREAYRAVLERLVSSGETERAVAELVLREAELFREDPSSALERLRSTEVTVARLLGEESEEGLLSLLMLHLEAYRMHRSRRDFALATHSRLTAADIAELYVQGGTAPEASALAADALVCLAGDVTESRLWKQSDLLLERAVELDSSNVLALLLLAANRERFGDYARAVDLLHRAVESDPRADEARLRLGVNLARLGRLKDSEQTLRQLLEVRAQEWIQALAYEELGRVLLSRSRYEEAARELRAGISRYPGQQGLHLLLSYVLERLGAPQEGAEVLARMPIEGGGEISPRHRYGQPRIASLAALRSALMRNAEVRLPVLAQALAAAAGEG